MKGVEINRDIQKCRLFKCLGSLVTNRDDMMQEKGRIIADSKCYHEVGHLLAKRYINHF